MKVAIIPCTSQLADKILIHTIKLIGKENVIGICRSPEKMKTKEYGIEVKKGDFSNTELLEKALEGVSKVLLVSSNSEPEERIQQHRNVINAAKIAKVKHFVYTSIIGTKIGVSGFDSIIKSNLQTEKEIMSSGLIYTIGRNAIYLDADLESIEMYKKDGCLQNCGGLGKTGLISREEIGFAYAKILAEESNKFDNKIFNISGELVSQKDLTDKINEIYDLKLTFKDLNVEEYYKDRINAHGKYFGGIIAGIYELMRFNGFEVKSDFKKITGRNPEPILETIKKWKKIENKK